LQYFGRDFRLDAEVDYAAFDGDMAMLGKIFLIRCPMLDG
jgi:hypothetical protein